MLTHTFSFIKFYFRSFRGLSSAAWRGVILTLVDSTMIGVYYFLSTYFMSELHFSVTMCGAIISCHGVGAIFGGRVGGKCADKFSASLVSACSLLVQAIGYLALVKLQTPTALMINTFFLGAASYAFITSNHVWTLQHTSENERMKAINLLSTASNLGLSLSAMVIGMTVGIGFHTLFIIVSALTLLCASYLFRQYVQRDKRRTNNTTDIKASRTEQQNLSAHSLKRSSTFLMLTCVLFTGFTVSQLSSAYPIYIQEHYPWLGLQGISILFAFNSILVVLIEAPLGDLIKHQNKMLMLGLGALILGAGMCMLTISYVFSLAIIACVIYTIGEIIFFCMAQLIAYENSSHNKKGSGVGTYRMMYAVSRVIGPAGGGFIYAHLGGNALWVISGIIGVLCFMGCCWFARFTSQTNRVNTEDASCAVTC